MTNETLSISLYKDIKSIIEESKKMVIRSVNTIMLQTYWSTRRRIVEEEQQGSARAEYGSTLLKDLSKRLTNEYGKGFSKSNLPSMRKLFIEFPKFQTLSGKLSWSHYLLLLGISDKNARSFMSTHGNSERVCHAFFVHSTDFNDSTIFTFFVMKAK